MIKLFISFIMALSLAVSHASAAEKKPIQDIDTNAFVKDTQVMPTGSGDGNKHVAMTWWIPNEFWQAILAKDATTNDADKQAMLDALSGVSLVAVVQADVTLLGAFNFYSKEEINKNMSLSYTGADNKKQRLSTMETITSDLEIVLGIFKPILGAAMGNLGNNFHFYVLNDNATSSSRLLDPYLEGVISIELAKRNGERMTATIEMPLNSLFIPRKCPNGKEAHISWKYCPWTGKKL